MLEQELVSIVRFILDNTSNSSPYYHNLPESFCTPATYFPVPEISSRGETFLTYALEYTWYVKFIDIDTQSAYIRANQALNALQAKRNIITLLDENGAETSAGLRLYDPAINTVDTGIVQIKLSWASRRPYFSEDVLKMQKFELEAWEKGAYKTPNISEALAAIEDKIKEA